MPTLEDDKIKREDQIDKRADDMFNNHPDLQRQEQSAGKDYTNSGIDQAQAYANDPANASANIDEIKDNENTYNYVPSKNDGGQKQSLAQRARNLITNKKLAPTGGVVAIVLAATVGLGGFFSPGLLFIQIKEVLANYNGSASRAAPTRYNSLLRNMIGGDAEKQCAKNSGGIRCRVGTMSEKQKAAYEREGFKIHGTTTPEGRTIIKEIVFPDGKPIVTNYKDFDKELRKSVSFRAKALRAFNPKIAIFDGGGRFSALVLKPLGLSKAKFTLEGKDEKERAADFDKKAGLDPPKEGEVDGRIRTKIKSGAVRAKNIGGVACSTYGISKIALGAAKLEASTRLARFAMPFLAIADEMKAAGNGGSPDIDTVSHLGTMLTKTDTTGEKKGLAATDSQGYKIAAYGGEGALKDFSKSYLVGGNKNLLRIENTLDGSAELLGGRENTRKTCRAVNSYAATGAECAYLGETLIGPFICVVGQVIVGFVAGEVIGQLVEATMPLIVKAILGTDISSNLYGVDAGNALAAGAGVIMLKSNLSKGMKPSKKADVSKFLAATEEDNQQYIAAMEYNARKTPFDIYNGYSFLGSLVRNSGIAYSQNRSFAQVLKNVGSLAFSGINLIPKASATASMPINITEEDLSHCEEADKDLAEIGIDCDLAGGVQGSLSPSELGQSVDDNLTYMINHHFVDENTGNPVDDDKNSYNKWVTYCTDKRVDPLGTPQSSPEDDDYNWQTGERCVTAGDGANEQDLSNFRVYYNTLSMKEEADGVAESNDSSGGNIGSGELKFPVDLKYWSSNKTYFTKGHGIPCGSFTGGGCSDIPLAKGTQVYAIAGGTVTTRPLGRASYACVGDPNGDNNGGLMIQSNIQGGVLKTAYAHGYAVTPANSVSAGAPIMLLGQVGNSCGPHIHIDMTFNGKPICPQDVFIAVGNGQTPDLTALTKKPIGDCAR